MLINLDYIGFIGGVSSETNLINSSTEVLDLSLDLASAAFTPATTKTILSSIAALTGGVKTSFQKNFLQEKTVSVLIAAMNAERKVVLTRILAGISENLDVYPFEQAIVDLDDFYMAGTFFGALNTLQKETGEKETEADETIKGFHKKRNNEFLSVENQKRFDNLAELAEQLDDQSLFDLNSVPPINDDDFEKVAEARDPAKRRLNDRSVALALLKMRILLTDRNDENFQIWEASIKSLIP